jgi:copper chaperone CopZ
MKTSAFTAPDIVCQGCANAIKKALGSIEGVSQIDVDVNTKTVQVTHTPQVAEATLAAALDRAGFPIIASSL